MKTTSLKNAAIINILGKYSGVVINLIYSAILARILSPDEFGVVAVILVFTTFFSLLADMGIGPAIIQNKELDQEDKKAIFAFTLYIGVILAIIFSFLSFPISIFYNNSAYVSIGMLLSIALFFRTINIVPKALLFKNLQFKLVAFRTVTVAIASAIPTIYFASRGLSYYSIVLHAIIVALLTFLWNYKYTSVKLSLRVKKGSLLKIKDFSKFQLGFSIINYFSRNIDNLLIGRSIGEGALGYYNRSYQLMQYPIIYLTHSITPVLHPILTRYENQSEIIYTKYIKLLKVLSLIGLFITIFSYFTAEEIILLTFGSQWKGSIRSFQFLALSIWPQMLGSSSGSIFQSLNKVKLMMYSGIISTSVIVLSIILGILLMDINKVALLVSLAYIFSFIQTFLLLIKFGFNKRIGTFFRNFLPELLIGILLIVGFLLLNTLYNPENLFISLGIKLTSSAFIYGILLVVMGQFKYFTFIINLKNLKGKFIKNDK